MNERNSKYRLRPGEGAERGFSLLEVAILTVFLLVAVGGLSSAVLSSLRLSRTTEESAIADDALRALAADMQTLDFADIFPSYNADPADDPAGAPGAAFDVRGLAARSDDPDGRVGRILFPTVPINGGPAEALREDVDDPRLGMPRDLNGDGGAPDALDHSNDYIALPARLVVEWIGAGGERSLELDLVMLP